MRRLTGLRAIKAVVEEYEGVNIVPITLGMLKAVNNEHKEYMEHWRQENPEKHLKEAEKS